MYQQLRREGIEADRLHRSRADSKERIQLKAILALRTPRQCHGEPARARRRERPDCALATHRGPARQAGQVAAGIRLSASL